MAYTSSDLYPAFHQPMVEASSGIGGMTWRYNSIDSQSTIGGSSYISDAVKRGLKVADQVIVYNSSSPSLASYLVKTVRSSVSSGSADLSSGMWLSS